MEPTQGCAESGLAPVQLGEPGFASGLGQLAALAVPSCTTFCVALILQANGFALFGEIPTFALFKCHMGSWYLTCHDADESMLPQKLIEK